MRANGEIHRGVISDEIRAGVMDFYPDIREGNCHGRLFFAANPAILEQIDRVIDLDEWIPYHDVFFSNTRTPPIAWHNGQGSVGMLREPFDNCSIWMPFVPLTERTGGRLIVLDTLKYSVPFFHYFRSVSQSYDEANRSRSVPEIVRTLAREARTGHRMGLTPSQILRMLAAYGGGMYETFLAHAIVDRASTQEVDREFLPGDIFRFNSLNIHRVEPYRPRDRRSTYVIRFMKKSNALVREWLPGTLRENLEKGRLDLPLCSSSDIDTADVRWKTAPTGGMRNDAGSDHAVM